MLKRKFETKLSTWLGTNKILLVDGARQVGKTYLIEDFCKRNFENYIYINLALDMNAAKAFAQAKNVNDFLFVVSSFASSPMVPSKTVIFIDEIQLAKEVDFQTMTKGFALDGRYRFIFSGSLLGVTTFNVALEPTGYLYEETMYPLDFEEFLWANKVQQPVIDEVAKCFAERRPVPSFVHEKMISLFYRYLLIGGMPDAVQTYVDTNDLAATHLAHKAIETFYKKDITKYAHEADRPYIANAYEILPSELSSKSKRFVLSKVDKKYSISRCENDFVWLKDAGAAIPVYNVDEPKAPLLLTKNNTLLKLFANDVGLLCFRLLPTGIQEKILAHEKDINFGGVFENAVAQELRCHGFLDDNLFYFSSKKQGEVDFLVTYKNEVLPIEVKSGKDYKRHVALENLLSNKEYGINHALIFGNCNVEINGKRTYLPIYMVDWLRQDLI